MFSSVMSSAPSFSTIHAMCAAVTPDLISEARQ